MWSLDDIATSLIIISSLALVLYFAVMIGFGVFLMVEGTINLAQKFSRRKNGRSE